MKKFLFVLVVFLSLFSLAQAQRDTSQRPSKSENGEQRPPRMDPAERIERETNQLKEKLSLTDDQVAKVKDIYTKSMEKRSQEFEKARESGEMDREAMHKKMKEEMDQENNAIKAILTDAQKVKFDAYIKEREERMKNMMGGPGPGDSN